MYISDLDKVLALSKKLTQQEELLNKIHNGKISQEEFDTSNKKLEEEIADEKRRLIESWTNKSILSKDETEL